MKAALCASSLVALIDSYPRKTQESYRRLLHHPENRLLRRTVPVLVRLSALVCTGGPRGLELVRRAQLSRLGCIPSIGPPRALSDPVPLPRLGLVQASGPRH